MLSSVVKILDGRVRHHSGLAELVPPLTVLGIMFHEKLDQLRRFDMPGGGPGLVYKGRYLSCVGLSLNKSSI